MAMLSLYSGKKEDSESVKLSFPPSRASTAPKRVRKLHIRGDSMKQEILTKNYPVLKQTRHKTSTWPSLQYKLWLDISNFPLHQLREDKRMRNEGKDIQRQRGGRPLTVMWSSYSNSNVDHTDRAATASILPSRIGPNTLVSYLRQREAGDGSEDKLLKLRTLVRNPSREGSCRLRALQLKKPPALSDVTPPTSPPTLTHCLSCKTLRYVIK